MTHNQPKNGIVGVTLRSKKSLFPCCKIEFVFLILPSVFNLKLYFYEVFVFVTQDRHFDYYCPIFLAINDNLE